MTSKEAIVNMQNGVKMTHPYFAPDEWVTMRGNKIVFEDGCEDWVSIFFELRPGKSWEKDWSIWRK